MCLTAPARVLDVSGTTATVEIGTARRHASTLLVPDVRPGDWVLLSAGTLLRVIDPRLAAELTAAVHLATEAGDAP